MAHKTWWKSGTGLTRQDHPLMRLQHEMNHLFDGFLDDFRMPARFESMLKDSFSPKLDIIEKEKEILIKADLPGVDEKDVDVSFADNSLIIKGERKEEKDEKKEDYHLVERSYGSFYRRIPMPANIDNAKIDATFKKGVLNIVIPKTADSIKNSHKINIKAA
ncbi:MAG: Hsp20/alpha crystallin family protein [Spirochaetia bacterium]|nr:Hsp20/alpha crystallin family protein [Spirochaetia bacterium]